MFIICSSYEIAFWVLSRLFDSVLSLFLARNTLLFMFIALQIVVSLVSICCFWMHWRIRGSHFAIVCEHAALIDGSVEEVLSSGELRLLSCSWLLANMAGRIIARFQDMPREAFVSTEAAVEMHQKGNVFVAARAPFDVFDSRVQRETG